MFFVKLLVVVGGLVFLGILFVRRLFLVVDENKMQAKLEKEVAKEQKSDKEDDDEPVKDTKKPPKKSGNIRNLFKKGEVNFSRKDYEAAEKCFVQVLAIDETHLDANLQLGLTYLKQGNYSKAEFFFHKLVNLKKDPVHYSNLGLALYNQGRLLEAAEAYENALSLDDNRAGRFASLAQDYRELNNEEKALANFEKASRKSPRNTDYLWALIEYYQKLGRQEDLERAAKRLLELDPYNKEAKKLLRA